MRIVILSLLLIFFFHSCSNIDLATLRQPALSVLEQTSVSDLSLSAQDNANSVMIVYQPEGFAEGDMVLLEYADDLYMRISYPPGYLDDIEAPSLSLIIYANNFPKSFLEDTSAMDSYVIDPGALSLLSLFSTAGYASLVYEVENPYKDWDKMLDYINKNKAELRLEMDFGLFGISGNGSAALTFASADDQWYSDRIKCLVLNHASSRTPRALRNTVPIYIFRKEDPQEDFVQETDIFVRRARAYGIPLTINNNSPFKNGEFSSAHVEEAASNYGDILNFYIDNLEFRYE